MRSALLSSLLLLVAAVVRGQDSPGDRAGPYLVEDAIAVGRFDLEEIDADAAHGRLAPFLSAGMGKAEGRDGGRFKEGLGSLREAGVREVFAVVSPADLPLGGPYFIIRPADGAGVESLLRVLRSPQPPLRAGEVAEAVGDAVFVGPASTLERLKAGRPRAAREGLNEAFAAVADSPVQVVLTLSDDHRRALREMLPDLPPDFGGLTGEQVASGVRWASVGMAFEPRLSVKLVVQAESEKAAEALQAAGTAGLRRLSTHPEVVRAFPAMPLFVGSLTPKREGDRLVLVADEALRTAGQLLGDVAGAARKAAGQGRAVNNLKQIGLAFHNFHDVYGGFPPSAGYDGERPLLSWRVYLLPWLEQAPLYQQFRLDEPWDSEHNRRLVEQMPDVYRSPNVETPPGHMAYLVPAGDGLMFGGKAGMPIRQIKDGTSNTILVVEAAAEKAVPWTKPDDLTVDRTNPLAGLAGGRESFGVLFADGSVRQMPATVKSDVFVKFLTPAGGEPVNWEEVGEQ